MGVYCRELLETLCGVLSNLRNYKKLMEKGIPVECEVCLSLIILAIEISCVLLKNKS